MDDAAGPFGETAARDGRGYERWYALLVPLVILVVWEIAARSGWLPRLFFPAPSQVIRTLLRLTASGVLPDHLSVSLRRVVFGFLVGAVPGVTLGLTMGFYRPIRLLFDPIVAALYPVPRLALFPLIMLIFGIGETSMVAIIGVGVFFPALINAMAGVRGIPEVYFEVARSYGASPWNLLRRVVLPGSLPMVFVGLRLALGLSLLLVIGVEFISARTGLGAFLWMAWETFRTEYVYVGLLVSALLGAAFTTVLSRVERRLLPWVEGFLHR